MANKMKGQNLSEEDKALKASSLAKRCLTAVDLAKASPVFEVIKKVQSGSAPNAVIEYADLANKLSSKIAFEGMFSNLERLSAASNALALVEKTSMFRAGMLGVADYQPMLDLVKQCNSSFILPEIVASESLSSKFLSSPIADILDRYTERASAVQSALASMRSPWLNVEDQLLSISAFTKIHGMGSILSHQYSFSDDVENALREDLGDWRDPITWSKEVETDLDARSEFYQGLGFDPSITDFPAETFDEVVQVTGLSREKPSLVALYGSPVPVSNIASNESAFARAHEAYEWLLGLETHLRLFIQTHMLRQYGENWPKTRLPKDIYESWVGKRSKAQKDGRKVHLLIAYADFTEYERIICKRDNWREVFEAFGWRQESLRESFQRLHMLRLDTMHARPISSDDLLLLYVEVKRLMGVLGS